jgi:tRNA pseudouridine38-40 synthase
LSSSDLTTSRWRFDIAYDGARFRGFADQPGQETVVGTLGTALARCLRLPEPPTIVGAGRTDAGVHAIGQVVHVDLPTPLFADERGPAVDRLMKSLNGQMGSRIVVLAATPVDARFDARFSATSRSYRYLVVESDHTPTTLTSTLAWTVPGPFDEDALHAATDAFLGLHDFRSFCRRPPDVDPDQPLTRNVTSAQWRVLENTLSLVAPDERLWRFDITATSFCRQMVRAITACIIDIARGRAPVSIVDERFAAPRRDGLAPPAPAAGLSLVSVGYD